MSLSKIAIEIILLGIESHFISYFPVSVSQYSSVEICPVVIFPGPWRVELSVWKFSLGMSDRFDSSVEALRSFSSNNYFFDLVEDNNLSVIS